MFKLYTEKIGRPVGKINYVELAEFTHDYTSSDIKVICDEVARNMAGKSIGKKKVSLINTKDILEVVKTTQSSLIHVDVNIFDKFKKL